PNMPTPRIVSYGDAGYWMKSEFPETMEPPGGGRERVEWHPLTRRRKPDKQVTNGVVESISEAEYERAKDPLLGTINYRARSPNTYLLLGICFPGLLAGHKGTEGHLRLTEKRARPMAAQHCRSTTYQRVSRPSVLTLPKPGTLSPRRA